MVSGNYLFRHSPLHLFNQFLDADAHSKFWFTGYPILFNNGIIGVVIHLTLRAAVAMWVFGAILLIGFRPRVHLVR